MLREIRKGLLEPVVLGVLSRGDNYGFSLASRLGERSVLFSSQGTIYPLLARMSREGLVEAFWRESTEGPPRKYYRITAAGLTYLNDFRRLWPALVEQVDDIIK